MVLNNSEVGIYGQDEKEGANKGVLLLTLEDYMLKKAKSVVRIKDVDDI